jgi:hypothetical protein
MKISSFDPRRQLQYFACRLAVKLGGLILPGRKMDKTPTMNFAISLARELRLTRTSHQELRFLRPGRAMSLARARCYGAGVSTAFLQREEIRRIAGEAPARRNTCAL